MSAALDGEISPAERNRLDAHLADCPPCAELFAELAGQSALLRRMDCQVPAGLSNQILSQLPRQKKKAPIVHIRRWGTLAACLALAVVGSFAMGGSFSANSARDADAAAYLRTADDAAPAPSSILEVAVADSANVSSEAFPAAGESDLLPADGALTQTAPEYGSQQQAPAASQIPAEKEATVPETTPTDPESCPPEHPADFDPISGIENWTPAPEFSFTPQFPTIGSTGGAEIRGVHYLRTDWLNLGKVDPVLITAPEDLAPLKARYPALSETLSAYDDGFFRSSSLIAVTMEEGSGSITHTVESILPVAGGWSIRIAAHVPEIGTCDMAGWLILIETAPVFSPGDVFTVNGTF